MFKDLLPHLQNRFPDMNSQFGKNYTQQLMAPTPGDYNDQMEEERRREAQPKPLAKLTGEAAEEFLRQMRGQTPEERIADMENGTAPPQLQEPYNRDVAAGMGKYVKGQWVNGPNFNTKNTTSSVSTSGTSAGVSVNPQAAPNYGLPLNNGSGQYLSPDASWNNMINTIAPQGQLSASLRADPGDRGDIMANQEISAGKPEGANGPIVNDGVNFTQSSFTSGNNYGPIGGFNAAPMSLLHQPSVGGIPQASPNYGPEPSSDSGWYSPPSSSIGNTASVPAAQPNQYSRSDPNTEMTMAPHQELAMNSPLGRGNIMYDSPTYAPNSYVSPNSHPLPTSGPPVGALGILGNNTAPQGLLSMPAPAGAELSSAALASTSDMVSVPIEAPAVASGGDMGGFGGDIGGDFSVGGGDFGFA